MQLKNTIKYEKKTEDSDAFSEVNHKHDDPVVSLDYAHDHMSNIYVTIQLAKSTHQLYLLRSKIQQVGGFTHLRKDSDVFNVINRDVTFASAKTLHIQVPLQNFLFL